MYSTLTRHLTLCEERLQGKGLRLKGNRNNKKIYFKHLLMTQFWPATALFRQTILNILVLGEATEARELRLPREAGAGGPVHALHPLQPNPARRQAIR